MNLIDLFNARYDYACLSRGVYFGVDDPRRATHSLVCTSWNSDHKLSPNLKKRIRELKTRPTGYALAVCAVPLRRRAVPTLFKFRRAIPGDLMPIYEKHGSLTGKRRTLHDIAGALKHPRDLRRKILSMGNAKCDALYLQLCRANHNARRK
jgi:hypothetical protein